jgi:hypothetical protein
MGSWSFELQPAGFHGGECVTTAGTKHAIGSQEFNQLSGAKTELIGCHIS